MHALDKLEPAQLELLAVGIQHLLDSVGDLGVRGEFPEPVRRVRRETEDGGVDGVDRDVLHAGVVVPEHALGERDECRRFGDQDTDEVVLERVPMHIELLNDWARRVRIFELLQRDVLSLCEFHNVLGERREVDAQVGQLQPNPP